MQVISRGELNMLIADEGKHIKAINDVYTPETKDENGEVVPEHFPEYSQVLFLAKTIDVDKIDEYYVEESIE